MGHLVVCGEVLGPSGNRVARVIRARDRAVADLGRQERIDLQRRFALGGPRAVHQAHELRRLRIDRPGRCRHRRHLPGERDGEQGQAEGNGGRQGKARWTIDAQDCYLLTGRGSVASGNMTIAQAPLHTQGLRSQSCPRGNHPFRQQLGLEGPCGVVSGAVRVGQVKKPEHAREYFFIWTPAPQVPPRRRGSRLEPGSGARACRAAWPHASSRWPRRRRAFRRSGHSKGPSR